MYIRKTKHKWNYKKIISNIFTAGACGVYLWLFVGYIEIISKNVNPGPVYSEYNPWILLFDFMMEVFM